MGGGGVITVHNKIIDRYIQSPHLQNFLISTEMTVSFCPSNNQSKAVVELADEDANVSGIKHGETNNWSS